jgi:hypothetical protein
LWEDVTIKTQIVATAAHRDGLSHNPQWQVVSKTNEPLRDDRPARPNRDAAAKAAGIYRHNGKGPALRPALFVDRVRCAV